MGLADGRGVYVRQVVRSRQFGLSGLDSVDGGTRGVRRRGRGYRRAAQVGRWGRDRDRGARGHGGRRVMSVDDVEA